MCVIRYLANSSTKKNLTIIRHPSNLGATKLVTHPVDSMVE